MTKDKDLDITEAEMNAAAAASMTLFNAETWRREDVLAILEAAQSARNDRPTASAGERA